MAPSRVCQQVWFELFVFTQGDGQTAEECREGWRKMASASVRSVKHFVCFFQDVDRRKAVSISDQEGVYNLRQKLGTPQVGVHRYISHIIFLLHSAHA